MCPGRFLQVGPKDGGVCEGYRLHLPGSFLPGDGPGLHRVVRQVAGPAVSFELALAGLLGLGLMTYLLFALLNPERFN